MTSESVEVAVPLVVEAFTIDVGEYCSCSFEFQYRVDGSGDCTDVDCGGAEIPFAWDLSLIEGLAGEDRKEALHDHAREIFWDEINDQLDEDRVLTEGDYGSEEVTFESGSSEDLERLIQLILYSFPDIWTHYLDEITVSIYAGTESEEACIDEDCDLMLDAEIPDEERNRMITLIGYALDLYQPSGSHLEYNDGASGRASGYYESPGTVYYSIPKPSFHELAEAREQLIAAFGDMDEIQGIVDLLPQEAESHGECAISQ
jgi:hypothetical protein